jgi:hypothetical protein
MNAFLIAGILLMTFGLFSLVYSAIDPDGGDSVRAIFIFGTPLFPAMMGLVLIVAGYAVGLLSRTSWDTPQIA